MAEASVTSPRLTPAAITVVIIVAFTFLRLIVLANPAAPLSMDEAQYWLWSRDLAAGYFSKPPLLSWIIAATTAVCGEGEGCIRASAPLFHAGTALLIFGIGQRLFNAHVGTWSAVTYIVLPGVSVSAVVISTDVPLLFFWALALYALVRLRAGEGAVWWAMLGVALGLGTLSKYAMLFFVLGLVVWAIIDRDARALLISRDAFIAGGVALLIVSPNVVWNINHAFVSVTHVADNMAVSQARFDVADALDFIGAQAGIFGPILFVALIAALWRPPAPLKPRFKMLAAFCVPVLVLMTAQALLSRAHANWAATSYIAATLMVVAWCLDRDWTGSLRVSWVLHVFAATVLYNYEAVAQSLGVTLNRKIDPAVRTRSWDAAGVWTSALRQQFPNDGFLFDERHTYTALSYYTQPHPFGALMWNPFGKTKNHFEMMASLRTPTTQSFIYVTKLPTADAVAAFFDTVAPLGHWHKQSYPGHDLALNAFRLTGFRGYNAAPGSK